MRTQTNQQNRPTDELTDGPARDRAREGLAQVIDFERARSKRAGQPEPSSSDQLDEYIARHYQNGTLLLPCFACGKPALVVRPTKRGWPYMHSQCCQIQAQVKGYTGQEWLVRYAREVLAETGVAHG